jgi:catechol 2,3-dioxygenase-like lactoylglutathione lyase family enzyme
MFWLCKAFWLGVDSYCNQQSKSYRKELGMSFKVEGVHHIGITVRNMQRSFDWYTKMFGLEPGPVNHGEGKELSDAVQVEGTKLSFSMIDIGATRIEFLEYHEPTGKDFALKNGDVGATHICLQIDDMDAAYETLLSRGAVFNAPPVTLTDGDLAGSRWAYLRDPDGIQLEIWAWPK